MWVCVLGYLHIEQHFIQIIETENKVQSLEDIIIINNGALLLWNNICGSAFNELELSTGACSALLGYKKRDVDWEHNL